MNKQLLILGAVGIAALVAWQKGQAAAAKPAAGGTGTGTKTTNALPDMWTRILSGGWTQLEGGAQANGKPTFILRDLFGKAMTSDGEPIGTGDPIADWITVNTGLPSYGEAEDIFTVRDLLGKNTEVDSMWGFRNPNAYW